MLTEIAIAYTGDSRLYVDTPMGDGHDEGRQGNIFSYGKVFPCTRRDAYLIPFTEPRKFDIKYDGYTWGKSNPKIGEIWVPFASELYDNETQALPVVELPDACVFIQPGSNVTLFDGAMTISANYNITQESE